jgi:hypothetical protein
MILDQVNYKNLFLVGRSETNKITDTIALAPVSQISTSSAVVMEEIA